MNHYDSQRIQPEGRQDKVCRQEKSNPQELRKSKEGAAKNSHSRLFIDLAKMTFGRLTVVRRIQGPSRRTLWECKCSCGKVKTICAESLRAGKTKSCGCLASETARKFNRAHGLTSTPTWRSWQAMLTRCNNPNRRSWHNYGGRRIVVCDRWKRFENFLLDMGDRPPGKTLDRWPNKDGNYEPGNCRWATPKEQGNNTRKCRLIEFDGKIQTIMQWAEEIGISPFTLYDRANRGLTPHDILKK